MARKSQRPPTNCTILIVDDQEEVLISMQQLLEREGHQVLGAPSGEQALALFRTCDVTLLIVDYFMPRMTGELLIRKIRRLDPFVQIILQTGYAGEKPARVMMAELDIQGYHDKTEGPDKLLLWVDSAIKAHRLMMQLRERERLQGELVANLSHEFRTPLHIIGGYTDLLSAGDYGELPPETRGPLQGLTEATRGLAELVDDFLHYAQVRAGALDLSEQRIAINDLSGELARLATVLLAGRDVRFELDLEHAPPFVCTDSVKLRTILRNLVVNAAKFTGTGCIGLRVWQENDALRFAVRDTGPGIPAHQQASIFEPFRQLDGSVTRSHRGVGLGLALSRNLATLLGGDIAVESRLGEGATFTLVLPQPSRTMTEDAAPPLSPPLADDLLVSATS